MAGDRELDLPAVLMIQQDRMSSNHIAFVEVMYHDYLRKYIMATDKSRIATMEYTTVERVPWRILISVADIPSVKFL